MLTWLDAGAPETGSDTNLPPLPPVPPIPPEVMPDPDKIDYSVVNDRVVKPRCLTCHSVEGGNKGDVNLESYENIISNLDDIKDDVTKGTMPRPKNKPLTDIQKQIILIWIEKGAPQSIPQ